MNLATILQNKTHIIYIVLIEVLGVIFMFLSPTPKEKIVTQVVTKEVVKYVDKIVIQKGDIVTDRTITTEAKDGSKTVIVEHIADKTIVDAHTVAKTESKEVSEKTEITKYQSRFTLTALLPVTPSNLLSPNPLDLKLVGGMRIFSLPILVNIGTNLKLNEYVVGLTLEL